MNILEALQEMSELHPATEASVRQMLDEDYHVIFTDKNNFGDNLLRYDLFVEDGILYCCKMSDSTRDSIVLTPEDAAVFSPEWFHILWESYLSGKDRVFIDTIGYMHSAEIRMGNYPHETIKTLLKGRTVFHFNDPYAEAEDSDAPVVGVYIIDVGIPAITDVLVDIIAAVPGATRVSSPNKADVNILPMPPWLTDGKDRLFLDCDWDMSGFVASRRADGSFPCTLLFCTNTAGKLAAKGKAKAKQKAAADFSAAIAEFAEMK